MNLKYLGDALDHFKGSILQRLQEEGLLQNLAVDPLATDAEAWTEADYRLYAQLLKVERSRIFESPTPPAPRGRLNPELIAQPGDIFLDPDTGVYSGVSGREKEHISPAEVQSLLLVPRVVAVYQHRGRASKFELVDKATKAIPAPFVSYVSNQVAMLFFSSSTDRIVAIADSLRSWLAPRADRVYSGDGK